MLEKLEQHQIKIYLLCFGAGLALGLISTNPTSPLEKLLEPAIAVLLYTMFCQIPFKQLFDGFQQKRFLLALMTVNFILIPLFIAGVYRFLPDSESIRFGIYLVLLTPCVDYVIFFTKAGKGDEKLMLASTPLLLLAQVLLLPFYLWWFMGKDIVDLIDIKPFIASFLWLILIPLALAILSEWCAKKSKIGKSYLNFTAWLPVPMMGAVLFVVAQSEINRAYSHGWIIIGLIPLYFSYMIVAGMLAWLAGRAFKLRVKQARTVCFSAATRNSLVVLPLALSLADETKASIAAAVIVTQTMIELLGELVYIRAIPFLISDSTSGHYD